MGAKISEEKLALIRKRLIQGVSAKGIADEVQVSEATVKRYKKSIAQQIAKSEEQICIGDTDIRIDYTTYLTKREEFFSEKIKKELMLYDDPEEGWVYHLSKGDSRLKQSGYWWSAIVYPESAPADWVQALRARGYRIAISPLHDKDTWNHDSPEFVDPLTGEIKPKGALYKTGDRKKAHWHIIVVVDKRTGYAEMNAELQTITHCPYIQKCRSLRNAFDYFLHINHPEKYQKYDKDEIQVYNNFHVEPTKYEQNIIALEMVRLIQEHNLIEWCEVVEFFQNDPEMSLVLGARTGYFNSYVKSRYYRQNPHTTKYTEVKQVNKFSFEDGDELQEIRDENYDLELQIEREKKRRLQSELKIVRSGAIEIDEKKG